MQARRGQRKRVWGPPATVAAYLASLGKRRTPGKGPFVFARSPAESWSTERLEGDVATLHTEIADRADPALLAPHINAAKAILAERAAQDEAVGSCSDTESRMGIL